VSVRGWKISAREKGLIFCLWKFEISVLNKIRKMGNDVWMACYSTDDDDVIVE
jgi:hypothetical protein